MARMNNKRGLKYKFTFLSISQKKKVNLENGLLVCRKNCIILRGSLG